VAQGRCSFAKPVLDVTGKDNYRRSLRACRGTGEWRDRIPYRIFRLEPSRKTHSTAAKERQEFAWPAGISLLSHHSTHPILSRQQGLSMICRSQWRGGRGANVKCQRRRRNKRESSPRQSGQRCAFRREGGRRHGNPAGDLICGLWCACRRRARDDVVKDRRAYGGSPQRPAAIARGNHAQNLR